MKDKLENDPVAANNFYDNLVLPKYDENENPGQIKEKLLLDKDDKEAEKQRKIAE